MTVKVGDVVELDRLGGGRFGPGKYVVAEVVGSPSPPGDMVRLVRKRPDGTYQQFLRAAEGLEAAEVAPFTNGETVRINGVGEEGHFIMAFQGVASVDIPAWSSPLEGGGKLALDASVARISYWSLVLENRL